MKNLLSILALGLTVLLLATGCKCSCCSKPSPALCPGDGGGCTNKFVVCPGCTNKLNLDLANCPGCTNKVEPKLVYIQGNLHEDANMIFDPVFAREF